jgi:hypothetical protein
VNDGIALEIEDIVSIHGFRDGHEGEFPALLSNSCNRLAPYLVPTISELHCTIARNQSRCNRFKRDASGPS